MSSEPYRENCCEDDNNKLPSVNNIEEEENVIIINEPIHTEDRTQLEEEMEVDVGNMRKRTRNTQENGHSSEDGWTQVSKGKKAGKIAREEEEEKINICVVNAEALPKQFALARLFTEHNISNITKIKYVTSTKIIITFDKNSSSDKFLQNKAFTDMGWRCYKTTEVGVSYGVIRNFEVNIGEQEIVKHIRSPYEIISAKRLNKREETKDSSNTMWVASESIRLAFKGATLPAYVYIHNIRIKVEPYKFPVTQCSKCWKFGHILKFCPSKKTVCPKCSKNHENCETTLFYCVNCTGPHMSLHRICPVYKKELKIRELMSQHNVTYRKALAMYHDPSPLELESTEQQQETIDKRQQDTNTILTQTSKSFTRLNSVEKFLFICQCSEDK